MLICNMGNQREYIPTGGFSQYLYKDVSETFELNDINAKIVKSIDVAAGEHDRLPTYSDTSDMYFKLGNDGTAIQAKLYIGRVMALDFDWGHNHKNKGDGKTFPKGTVHVQKYVKDKNGKFSRLSDNAQLMTDSEIAKYGKIILHFNPNVIFK